MVVALKIANHQRTLCITCWAGQQKILNVQTRIRRDDGSPEDDDDKQQRKLSISSLVAGDTLYYHF